jgi:predicted GNAT family N-acyltransferase
MDETELQRGPTGTDTTVNSTSRTSKAISIQYFRLGLGESEESPLCQGGILLRQTYLWNLDGCTLEDYRDSDRQSIHYFALLDKSSDAKCNQNKENGVVVGTVQYDPATNRLRQLIVDPSHRGQGVGAQLLSLVQAEAIERHQQESLKVHAWQSSAAFYAKLGFVAHGDAYESNGIMCQVMVYSAASVVKMD